ncbi:MAG: TlpA family protein disulfide reductase [Proteobacteria bacterium]|nr:TlpA family protein disulfide reductase [Pseudomonadota bacterium]MBI3498574.1 TlpA family protein disulfide reductase [Pseudomonadota bacterium]
MLALVLSTGARMAEARSLVLQLHEIPQPVPAIRFTDGEGHGLGLEDFRGKVVLLNLWATWCVPCRQEMPTLDRLQTKLGGPDFEVVALSIDRAGMDPVRRFYAEIGIVKLALYLDSSGKAARDLGVYGLPTSLLIGRDGTELGRLIGQSEWDSAEIVALIARAIAAPATSNSKEKTP